MVRTFAKISFCILIGLCLVSCSSLKSKHLVGQKAFVVDETTEETSLWEFEDNIFHVNAVDSSTLMASTLKWNKTKKIHEAIKREIVLTELRGSKEKPVEAFFLNLRKPGEKLYTILLLGMTSNEKDWLIFTINDDVIKEHIKTGKTKAVRDGDDFILGLSKKDLDNYIAENLETIFSSGAAGVIKKLDCTRLIK